MSERVTITRVEDQTWIGGAKFILALDGRPLITGSDEHRVRYCQDAVLSALHVLGLERVRFPIQGGPSIRWDAIAPHEAQALKNHGGQTLQRLAERGGLCPSEAIAVMEDRPWTALDRAQALAQWNRMVVGFDTIHRLATEPCPRCERVRKALDS